MLAASTPFPQKDTLTVIDERKLTERGLPSAVEAEQALLGQLLYDNASYHTYGMASLDERVFALGSNRRIFEILRTFILEGKAVDLLLLREHLQSSGELEHVGGMMHLLALGDNVIRQPTNAVPRYISVLREKYQLRTAMVTSQRIFDDAVDQKTSASDIIARSIMDLQELADNSADDAIQSAGQFLDTQGDPEQMFEKLATLRGINLGLYQFDEMSGGQQPGDLIIVAARPSMGKTAWACNVAWNVAVNDGKIVAFFTLEQNRNTMIRRMLASSARVEYKRIRDNKLTIQEKRLLLERRDMLAKAPLYLDDQQGLTASRIKSKCLRLKNTVGLDAVYIDQLSHVSTKDVEERGMQLREKVGLQTKIFKRMAKELNVPVTVFNQLKRSDGKGEIIPKLQDLKESGNIEEDADVVMFLHRPEYYDKTDATLRGKAQMHLAKNREGATGVVDCEYFGNIMKWEDLVSTQHSFDDYSKW